MTCTRRSRAAAAAVALLVVLPVWASPALAASTARTSSVAVPVSSGRWAAVPTTSTTAPTTTGPLTLTFRRMSGNANNAPPPQYFNVFNTGSFDLTGATYSVTPPAGTEVPVLETCSTRWDEVLHTCVLGTISAITPGTTSAVGPRAVGAQVRLRLRYTRNVSDPTLVDVGVAVARAQVRAGTTQSS